MWELFFHDVVFRSAALSARPFGFQDLGAVGFGAAREMFTSSQQCVLKGVPNDRPDGSALKAGESDGGSV